MRSRPDARLPAGRRAGAAPTRRRLLAGCGALWLAGGGTVAPAEAPAEVPVEAPLPRFRRGIGVSHATCWADVAPDGRFVYPPFTGPDRRFGPVEMRALTAAGLDFVRLAVDPGPLMAFDGERRAGIERRLDGIVRESLAHGLGVILDIHPSNMHPAYVSTRLTAGVGSAPYRAYLALVTRMAASLARIAAGRPDARLAFELMNEPEIAQAAWQPMLEAAYRAARAGAPDLPLVLGGGVQNAADALTAMDVRPFRDDARVLYTFHHYEPWQFTHQGSQGNPAFVLSDVPYPADAGEPGRAERASVARLAALRAAGDPAADGADARGTVGRYRRSGYDRAALARTFREVGAWAERQGVARGRIVLGEFGIRLTPYQGTPEGAAARARWLADVREAAEAEGFGWSAWVYLGPGGFSLARAETGPEIDPAAARVLGLDAVAGGPR